MAKVRAIGGVALGQVPRIVAAGGEAELDALAAAQAADLVELRADLFRDPTPATIVAALRRLRKAGRPIILTVRAPAEGGAAKLDDPGRSAIYAAGLDHADAIDVELASDKVIADVVPRARRSGRTVILSAHFLDATPPKDRLLALADRARTQGADVTKLAAHAKNLDDVRTLLQVTLERRTQGMITIAIGPAGAISRVAFPAAGSLLTYASVGKETAPGQLPLNELSALMKRLYPA